MLTAIVSNLALVGGIIILSRHIKPFWQTVIGVVLIVIGLIQIGSGLI
jgi:hypothetical protein